MDRTPRRISPASAALAAVGLLSLGFTLGGWAAQPARGVLTRSPIAGIAVQDDDYIYRIHADGSMYTLNLAQGRTSGNVTAADWELFKRPDQP